MTRSASTYFIYAGMLFLTATVYVATANLGLAFAVVHGNVTSIWPPSGIALAILMCFGVKYWPGVLLGAFIINAMTQISVATAGLIAIGNTLEGVLACQLLARWQHVSETFDSPQTIVRFMLISALACTVAATVGAASLAFNSNEAVSFFEIWSVWWSGDWVGILLITPLIISWVQSSWMFDAKIFSEALFIILLNVLVSGMIFLGWGGGSLSLYPVSYLVIPFLVWAGLRTGPRGTTVVLFMISIIAVLATVDRTGPFASLGLAKSVVLLQVYMSVCAFTALMVVAVIRRNAAMARQLHSDDGGSQYARRLRARLLQQVINQIKRPLEDVQEGSRVIRASGGGRSQSLQRIEQASRSLQDSLLQMQDLLSLERDDSPVRLEKISLYDVFSLVSQRIQDKFDDEMARVLSHVDDKAAQVIADKQRLVKVLLYWVEYAITATQRGSSIMLKSEAAEGDQVRITISGRFENPALFDGLLEELRTDRVQASSANTLQLMVSRKLVTAMQGLLGVKYHMANESSVWVQFPAPTSSTLRSTS